MIAVGDPVRVGMLAGVVEAVTATVVHVRLGAGGLVVPVVPSLIAANAVLS